MQSENLEKHIDFLLSEALKKCGNIYDAEDLTQETMVAALAYISQNKVIEDMRAWLLTVMNRKYYDILRKKYRQPTISIGENFDVPEIDEALSVAEKTEEAEQLRRAVAHLAQMYREVIVRYYMKGQSIDQISKDLKLPEGTVKSRLHLGRKRLKKGINNMKKYSTQSYSPINLHISYSGSPGRNGEPITLVEKDLTAQNILWLAYKKPLTVEEISHAIGIPTAYIESTINKLTKGELMKKIGSKYYTDFVIYTLEDKMRYIQAQKEFARDNFDLLWLSIETGLNEIKGLEFYKRLEFDPKNSLEMYFVFYCLDYGDYSAFSKAFNSEQIWPARPEGGRWIAFGNLDRGDFDPKKHIDLLSHSYSGERKSMYGKYADSKNLELHIYSPDGFPSYPYDRSDDYDFFPEHAFKDAEFNKLFYIIHKGIDPDTVGFNTEYFKAIPHLTKCKLLCEKNGKPALNIPVLNNAEGKTLWDIANAAVRKMSDDISAPLYTFLTNKNVDLPPHLDSVPLQKQYMPSMIAILFAVLREAIKRGKLYDGNYDDDSNGINQPPCPAVLIIED